MLSRHASIAVCGWTLSLVLNGPGCTSKPDRSNGVKDSGQVFSLGLEEHGQVTRRLRATMAFK
jgi:hypothetical protein